MVYMRFVPLVDTKAGTLPTPCINCGFAILGYFLPPLSNKLQEATDLRRPPTINLPWSQNEDHFVLLNNASLSDAILCSVAKPFNMLQPFFLSKHEL